MTNTVFEITELGLQLNGRMLMPGSKLVIKGAPHPQWLGAGRIAGQITEKRLEVASPAKEPAQSAPTEDESLHSVRAEYERVTGKKPHHKAKAETLQAEINAAQKDDE